MRCRSINDADPPRIALVGCGAIAESFYLPAFVQTPFASSRLTLVDINHKRAEAMAANFGIQSYVQNYKSIISDVDGAIVALPHQLHYEVTMDFLRAGVHVLCEKPLAETAEQTSSMVQQAERSHVSLCVNNTRRLFPSFKKVKELLTRGVIGKPISFHMEEGGEYNWPTASGFYFNSENSNHGVLMDRGAHVLDLVCWWFDSELSIRSYMDDSFGGVEAVAALDFLIGESTPGFIKLSWLSRLRNECVIQGEVGTLICEPQNWRRVSLIEDGRSTTIRLPVDQRYFSDFGLEIVGNFLGVIQERELPLVSGDDVVESIAVLEKCYQNRQRFSLSWMEAGRL